MLKAFLLLSLLHGVDARLNRKPLPIANLTVQGYDLPTTLAELKTQENDLVDTLFKIVEELVEIEQKAAKAEAEASAKKETSCANSTKKVNTTANVTSNATANETHPNGVYGDPKKAYLKSIWAEKKEELRKAVVELGALKFQLGTAKVAKDDALVADLEKKIAAQQGKIDMQRSSLEAKQKVIGAKFAPQCAKVIEIMVDRRLVTLTKLGLQDESVGLDMATHFQVQCPGAIPMPEDKCDKHATALGKLVDSKRPIVKKAALLKTPSDPQSGNEWCKNFFGEFFNSIFSLVGCFEC